MATEYIFYDWQNSKIYFLTCEISAIIVGRVKWIPLNLFPVSQQKQKIRSNNTSPEELHRLVLL